MHACEKMYVLQVLIKYRLGKNLTVSVKRRLRTRGKMQTECKMQTADWE